jgi:hypothetical protein
MKDVGKVFPSDKVTVKVREDDVYGGAHFYEFNDCNGFNNGKVEYTEHTQCIQFIRKEDGGDIVEGVQSEQLLIALIDRHKKLNTRFPSREGALAITKMEEALHWLEARVKERINRDVMGELKP